MIKSKTESVGGMGMETGHVEEFLVLVEERNYWRAAERLYMNQSTLSKHIKALERELEGELFTRTTRSVELTDYGRAFLPYARDLARIQSGCTAALRRLRESHSGQVRLYCIPALAQYGLTKLLVGFHRTYPDFFLRVEETSSYHCRKALEQRECELALCWEMEPAIFPGMGKALTSLPLVRDRLILTVVREHPLAGRERISLGELESSDVCLFKGYPAELARESCRRAGFSLRPACVTDATSNILDVLREENHVALLPEGLIRHAMDSSPAVREGYTLIELEETVELVLSLSHLEEVPLSAAGQRFWELFIQAK